MKPTTIIARALVAAVATATLHVPATAQRPEVGVDPRVELMSIIFRLAGNPEYNQRRFPVYDSAIDRHFAAHAEHAVVQYARKLRAERGVSFDGVMSMAVHVTDVGTLAPRAPLRAGWIALDQRWTPAQADTFLARARDFYRDARVADFFASQQPLYDTANARARKLIDENVDVEWFGRFFGAAPAGGFVLVPGLVNGGGNYGPKFRNPDSTEIAYAIIGIAADSNGQPRLDRSIIGTVVHEFNHSFVNHVVTPHTSALQPAGMAVYERVAEEMRRQAYGNWKTMIDESLVRAAVARYALAHEGEAAAAREVMAQRARGFLWMDELFDLLAEYEADRARWPSFASFLPRVVEFYRDLGTRIDAVVTAFDAERPRLESTTPANGASDVDPATTRLSFRFDRAMNPNAYNVLVAEGGRERFPEITGASFEADGRTFVLHVRLEPAHDYELTLGPGFRSTDGYPLALTPIRFRTR